MRTLGVLGLVIAGFLAPLGSAAAQTLSPGDKLTYETVASFGFESLPMPLRDPCTIETRLTIGVGKVDDKGMDVDIEISVGVRAVRYRGPSFCWALEPATADGFIANPLSERDARELSASVLPRNLPPLARELVRRQLDLAATVASLHGKHASARVACGPEPFVRIDHIDAPAFLPSQAVLAERYLRSAILLAFPPVPLDLPREAERYAAGGSKYEVVGLRDAIWPVEGRAHRVRATEASSAARAAFAYEAMHDTNLERVGDQPRVREWSDVHAALGIAGTRHVRVVSALQRRERETADPVPVAAGAPAAKGDITAVASWHADLVRAARREAAVALGKVTH